jgi:nicotinamidase-related amidase
MTVQPWTEVLDDETRALLAERPDRPGLGKRPALIAVDLYDLVYDGGARPVHELMDDYPASCGEFAWNALPATVDLYAVLRRAGIPIVHVTYDTRAETDPKRVHPTNRKRRQPDLSLYKIKGELTPLEGELVVYKKRASAFFGTPLCAYLNEMMIDSVILIGESTSGCLRSSVVEAWSYGYPVTVVADSVFDRHGFINKVNLLDLHLKYATVMPYSALAAEIGRRSIPQV